MRFFLVVIISVFLLLDMTSLVAGTGTNDNDGDITQAEQPGSTSTWQRFSRNLRSFSFTRSTSKNSKISESSSSESDENPVCPPGRKSLNKLSRGFSRTLTKLKSMRDDATQSVTKGLARITSRVGSFRGDRGILSKQSSFPEDSSFGSPPRDFSISTSSPDVFSNGLDISLTPPNTPPKPSRKTRSPSKSSPRNSPKSSPKSSSAHSPPSPRNFFSNHPEEGIPIPWCMASPESAAYLPVKRVTSPPASRLSPPESRSQLPPASSKSHLRPPPPPSKSPVASSPLQKTLSGNIPRRTISSKSPRKTERSPSSRSDLQPPRNSQPSPRRSPPKGSKQAPRRHLSLVKWQRETPQEPKKDKDVKQDPEDTSPFNPPNKPLKLPSKRRPYFTPNQNPPIAPLNSPVNPSANVRKVPQRDRINEGKRAIPKMNHAWFNPDQRAFDHITKQLMDSFSRQEVPDRYAYLKTLNEYFHLRYNNMKVSRDDPKASKQFLEKYCLGETPGEEISLVDDAATIIHCKRKCIESWGYVYYVPKEYLGPSGLRFLRRKTSVELFACGQHIPVADGYISEMQEPTITPGGKIKYRCVCNTTKEFIDILDELEIDVNEFKSKKSYQEALEWLNLKLNDTNVQHVQLLTEVEYEERLRDYFRKKGVPSVNEDMSPDHRDKINRAIGGESESRADEDYWKGMQFYRG